MKAYDLIILGTGPAGLQAAIHAARAKVSVLVLGRQPRSSLYRAHIENYCCLAGITGEDLLLEGQRQAEKFGAAFLNEDVIEVSTREPSGFWIKTESGEELAAGALILSMGISRNKLNVPGEKELLGRGVSYCVDCDANFFRGLPVAVIGSGSAAASGALTLLFYASEVHLVPEKLDVSERLAEQIRASSIVLHEGGNVQAIAGQNEVEGLLLKDGHRLEVKGVFIELGAKGAIELATRLGVNLDAESFQYIVTDKKQATNIPGVYAAGDITGPPWQMAKAVGEGCVAGLEAAAYVKKLRSAVR
ncbi:MAG: NAD(P)/FAD-dependent oxidoreductase [Deltaproteobacteria bacterium]|nr:NAD(P)/FAD-dependent oxidoreductase [Deltaproteobacteria bacterium]